MQRLHTHAFFLYGVVVGLAIREALVRAGTHIFLPTDIDNWKVHLESFRLVVFLLAISCFYFGSGTFFNKVYLNEETAPRFVKKSYGLDFALGLIHFLIFFAWSLSIADHSRAKWGISPFLGFMSAILLYDLVWLVCNIRFDSLQEIKLWTFMTTLCFGVTGVVFFATRALSGDTVIAEEVCFIVVSLYLLGDATELFSGKPFFSELIRMLLPKNL